MHLLLLSLLLSSLFPLLLLLLWERPRLLYKLPLPRQWKHRLLLRLLKGK